MKYSEAKEFADGLRKLADFVEKKGPQIPGLVDYIYLRAYQNDVEDMKRAAHVLGTCEKVATDYSFDLRKKFSNGVTLEVCADRAVVCTKKVVGTKMVPKRVTVDTDEMVEQEIVEWECPPALLS